MQKLPRRAFWNGLILTAVLGVGVCLYLTYLALVPEAGDLCQVMGGRCGDLARSSEHGIWGIPAAVLGLGYFCFFLLYAVLNRCINTDPFSADINPALLVNIIGLAGSAYYLYLLLYVLKVFCIACLLAHLVNIFIFLLTLWGVTRRQDSGQIKTLLVFGRSHVLGTLVIAAAVAFNLMLGISLGDARQQLATEQNKTKNNLSYYKYLYDTSAAHDLEAAPMDEVLGEPGIAVHQIVCFYKEGCSHCQKAKDRLTEIVYHHDTAVYLVMKNIAHVQPDRLQALNVNQVPSVFIDGKAAFGWQVPGFLDPFINDCGC